MVQEGSLGLDALSQEWPTGLLYTSPLTSDFQGPPEDQGRSLHISDSCSMLAGKIMLPGTSSTDSGYHCVCPSTAR